MGGGGRHFGKGYSVTRNVCLGSLNCTGGRQFRGNSACTNYNKELRTVNGFRLRGIRVHNECLWNFHACNLRRRTNGLTSAALVTMYLRICVYFFQLSHTIRVFVCWIQLIRLDIKEWEITLVARYRFAVHRLLTTHLFTDLRKWVDPRRDKAISPLIGIAGVNTAFPICQH